MLNLKIRLHQLQMTVRELAAELNVPLKTVEDWAYRGVAVKIGGIESSYPIFAHGAESRFGTRRALDGKLH